MAQHSTGRDGRSHTGQVRSARATVLAVVGGALAAATLVAGCGGGGNSGQHDGPRPEARSSSDRGGSEVAAPSPPASKVENRLEFRDGVFIVGDSSFGGYSGYALDPGAQGGVANPWNWPGSEFGTFTSQEDKFSEPYISVAALPAADFGSGGLEKAADAQLAASTFRMVNRYAVVSDTPGSAVTAQGQQCVWRSLVLDPTKHQAGPEKYLELFALVRSGPSPVGVVLFGGQPGKVSERAPAVLTALCG